MLGSDVHKAVEATVAELASTSGARLVHFAQPVQQLQQHGPRGRWQDGAAIVEADMLG